MKKLNLILFCGTSFATQILASKLTREIISKGHMVNLVFARKPKALKHTFPEFEQELFLTMDILEDFIYPYLDALEVLPGVKCLSPGQLAQHYSVPLRYLNGKEVNSTQTLQFIEENDFDGGISVRFPFIIKAPIINAFSRKKGGFLWNLHSANLPEYQGFAPLKWMMYDKRKSASFTLHHLTEAVDSGDIIATHPQPLDLEKDFYSNMLGLIPNAVEMTTTALERIANGQSLASLPNSPPKGHRYCHIPTPTDWELLSKGGVKMFDKELLKRAYLKYFSIAQTSHEKGLKNVLNTIFQNPLA